MYQLHRISEPKLRFGFDQALEDPRDGITLFGPLDVGKPFGIRTGVVGTAAGLQLFRQWLGRIQGPIGSDRSDKARPAFPGFEAAFRVPWNLGSCLEIEIPSREIDDSVYLDDAHQRVYRTVNAFSRRISNAVQTDERTVDVWFVIIPDIVWRLCRPQSTVPIDLRIPVESRLTPSFANRLQTQKSMFEEDNVAAIPYGFDVHFRNQLKARLLSEKVPTQVVRELTLSADDPRREILQSDIAWNLSTAAFYKSGGRPWKLADIRPGVCYLGLAFKRDDRGSDPRSACCAAQMFLDSGDGTVFKGALGPWYWSGRGNYHLSPDAARNLVQIAVGSYKDLMGEHPREIFIHGRVAFEPEEWEGFQSGVYPGTKISGIRIKPERDLRLYRMGKMPPLRGQSFIQSERSGVLWTRGYIPRLGTYDGREVPVPTYIDICAGDADIKTVLSDVMSLTKLNYNSCRFADVDPVTLKFAYAFCEVLTSGPSDQSAPLPFKFYI